MAAPATTSLAWCIRVWIRLAATMAAVDHHNGLRADRSDSSAAASTAELA